MVVFVTSNTSINASVALDNINVSSLPSNLWTTNSPNGNNGWSSNTSQDIFITENAIIHHVGDYTLTVTDGNGCVGADFSSVINNDHNWS